MVEHGLPPGVFSHGRHVTASTIDLERLIGNGASEVDRRARHGLVVMGVFGDWVHVSFNDFKEALAYNRDKSDEARIGDGWIRPSENWSGDGKIVVWFAPK